MPVLLATRVSILAVLCLSCFHALAENPLPSQNTTGVARSHMMIFIYGTSMKNMPITAVGRASAMAQTVLCLSCAYLLS